ncbi:MAG TPA: 16S rRNA (adenine(1518)-N(6)/adenine(1519)-N(6))-dimethyltransferase RsmA [Humidesulfovibrio sp.]|uniref:16S rRNA (adenine(1518)-N(6)/adenine(1519)-N(6))- dimethyltransferase RsmA n=1 Tax=Humidesulfovibrio sp. TaxID=2910988 RepID=UPI002CCDB7ED|nr:16S rRNA (adenine(1518)-N(6)/adenine(1519)-N(6))-dimethyltransferase RsmA [Humidesulfovibrio sp.]HWR02722.1 16S rRNA (adenine(1518)-N(6)/adenine(1519)-N(6))-dimethyltransferase RsmA [Humidesulfovibrio sp.]
MHNNENSPVRYAPAKRSLGQNFLVDQNICRKIVHALDLKPGDKVLEIGPGRGALTRHVAERAPGKYVALEMDDALADELERQYPDLEVVRGDAMTFDWASLAQEDGWKIVGNLPYNIASPLIWDIVSKAFFARAVFMVQLEAGQRLAARSGGRDYGALSVFVQSHAEVELLFKVPPHVFRPQPKVTSAVLRFFLRPQRPTQHDALRLSSTLRMCFQQRRKQLGTIMKSQGISGYLEMLSTLDIDPVQRPETLGPEQFRALSKLLPPDFLA